MPFMWRWGIIALVGLLGARVAHAGNDDEILVGNDAAIAAGAVTAVVNDASSLYYNPAGLVGINDDSIDVSGSAYTLRVYDGGGILQAADGTVGGGSFVEIVVVPSSVAYARRLTSSMRVGFGLFTLQQSDLLLRTRVVGALPDGEEERLSVTLTDKSQQMVGIVGFGWRARPDLQVGASLSFGYVRSESSLQFGSSAQSAGSGVPSSFFAVSELSVVQGLSMRVAVGAQWQMTPHWRLGATLQTPSTLVYFSNRDDSLATLKALEESVLVDTTSGDSRLAWETDAPARFRLGLAYTVRDRLWISVDVDVQSGVKNPTRNIERDVLFNGRVGAEYQIGREWSIGAGAFTDLSATQPPRDGIDYYGFTVGGRYRQRRELNPAVEDDDRLTFETVVAVRYAYGSGTIEAIRVDFDETVRIEPFSSDSTVHEFSLHVGGALHF